LISCFANCLGDNGAIQLASKLGNHLRATISCYLMQTSKESA